MSALQRQILKTKLPPLPPRGSLTSGLGGGRRALLRKRCYSPLSWDKYFQSMKDITLPDGSVFRVYLSGDRGPLLLMLHGGGYCGLTWSLFCSNITTMVECQVAAIDLRGHGETRTLNEEDLSAETLASDVGNVFNALYQGEEPPAVLLVGHSMGGAIAVHAAYEQQITSLIGLIVIDVVEGTAMDALQSMQSFLRSRPVSFPSLENAVEWCVRSGQVRNLESARVSMPGQLRNSVTNKPATQEIASESISLTDHDNNPDGIPQAATHGTCPNSIMEEDEDGENDAHRNLDHQKTEEESSTKKSKPDPAPDDQNTFKAPEPPAKKHQYHWRIDLSKTEQYWEGWFSGLSNLFLSCTIPKLLLLAGVDRLDRDLTIGQMQGKFQMQVLPQCGHAVHEDCPDKVAEAIATFLVRNKFTTSSSDFQWTFPAC